MQVLIRRKGVSLRAEWDGLAKPSDKQLHYWLRPAPDAPVANAQTAKPVTDFLTASTMDSSGVRAVSTQTVRSATIVLYKGLTGSLERPLDAPVLGSTTVTDANAVIVNYATGPVANAQVIPAVASSYSLNLLSLKRIMEHVTPKTVNHTAYKGHEVLRFAGHGFENCYQVAANQMVEAVKFRMNLLNGYGINVAQKSFESPSADRQETVVIRAPLPSGELLRANESSYDAAPAPTDPDHMELVTQVNDALAHTHWSRTPKPTHFVQESQEAAGSDELVRKDTPTVIVQAGKWGDVRVYNEEGVVAVDGGLLAGIRALGSRKAISLYGTNGLTAGSFSQSGTQTYYKYTYCYRRYSWSSCSWRTGTRYQTTDPAYKIFSGATTGIDVPYDKSLAGSTWGHGGTTDQWVQVDFGQVVEGIDGLLIAGDGSEKHMKQIKVLISDNGSSWHQHAVVTTSGRGARDTFDLTPFAARFVRLQNNSNWGDEYSTTLRGVEILKRS